MSYDEPRWNKYVTVDSADTTVVSSETSGTLREPFVIPAHASTPMFRHVYDRFAAFIVPFGIAAAFLGPPPEDVWRRVRTSTVTNAPFVVFSYELDDRWQLHVELVTPDEVRELQRLWALPYPGPPDGDFRVPD